MWKDHFGINSMWLRVAVGFVGEVGARLAGECTKWAWNKRNNTIERGFMDCSRLLFCGWSNRC